MGWIRWFFGDNHGKERTTTSSDSKKQEFLVGKRGEAFSSHVSVTTKSDGSKSAHAGPHRDKK